MEIPSTSSIINCGVVGNVKVKRKNSDQYETVNIRCDKITNRDATEEISYSLEYNGNTLIQRRMQNLRNKPIREADGLLIA